MNPRNKNIQYIALSVAFITVALGIYLYSPVLHSRLAYFHVDVSNGSSTITVSTEKLIKLEQEAAIGRRLLKVQNAILSTNATTSILNSVGTSTPHEAIVIGRPPQSPHDTLVINLGINDGVDLGSAVWWPAGVYLGEVTDVREKTSIVQLVSSPGVEHSSYVSDIPIITQGHGGNELYAEAPESIEIFIGDAVTSDQYKLPIGVVAHIRDISSTNQQALYISRYVSSAVIHDVYVER
jgi:cell shape-determining protein MreC